MTKSVTDVQAPSASPEETAINKKILDLLNQQEKDVNDFKPILLDQYGFQESTKTNPYGYNDVADLENDLVNKKRNFGENQATYKGIVDTYNQAYDTINQANSKITTYQNSIDKLNKQLVATTRPDARNNIKNQIATQTAVIKDLQTKRDAATATRETMTQKVRGLSETSKFYEKTPERLAQEQQIKDQQALEFDLSKKASELINKQITDELAGGTPLEKANQELGLIQAQRTKDALEGKLPVSEALKTNKSEEFKLLKANAARLGHTITGDAPETAVADTTAGNELLGQFNRRYGLLEDAERRGEITQGSANFLNSATVASGTGGQGASIAGGALKPGGYSSVSPAFTSGSPNFGYAGLLSQYGSALQPYQFNRSMQFSAGSQTQQNRSGLLAGLLQAGGTAASAYMLA